MAQSSKENTTTRASLELLYHVSRELSASLDLSTLLRRIMFLSLKAVKGISGSIIVMDEHGVPVDSAIIHAGQVFDETTRQLRATLEQGLAGWVVRNEKAALVSDTSKDDRWLKRPDDDLDQTGPKSSVSAPVMLRDKLVGVMTLTHPTPGYFTQEHLNLVQALADQAGIAVQNAQLYRESQRKAQVMSALAESAASINATLNLRDVLQRILTQISQALQVEVVSLALIDSRSQELEYRAAIGSTKDMIVGERLKLGQGVAGWVAENGKAAIIPQAHKDPRFFSGIDERLGFSTRAIVCAPIRSQGQVIGILEALNPVTGNFDSDALLVLTGIGNLAGTAITHAQLFEEVQQAHRRFRDLFEDSIDPIFVTDIEGKIVEANRPAEIMTGFDDNTLANMSIHHFHQVDWKVVGQDFENLQAGTCMYEATMHSSSGDELPIEVFVRQVNIDSIPHLQWIMRDITQRKQFEKMREDLVSSIYHDLRSPLANVVSGLDMLQTMPQIRADSTLDTIVDIAMRSTDRIQRLTQSLLDTTRLEAGQKIGDALPTSVAELVNETVDVVAPHAESKQHELSVSISENVPNIMVDPDMMKRVLINLTENAIKYTPPGGKITIGAKRKSTEVHIWVEDTGRGIPPEDQHSVFEKFTRVRSGGTGGTRGLGLGLAFCKLAVENHGGKIWVESEVDRGSRFTFTAPIA